MYGPNHKKNSISHKKSGILKENSAQIHCLEQHFQVTFQ